MLGFCFGVNIMPMKPLHPCGQMGCPELVRDGPYCEKHKKEKQKVQDQRRGSAYSRGYDKRWQTYRLRYLNDHPLCECKDCKESDRILAASVVDHIIPHKGDTVLFWDPKNHQAMAKRCHDIKTAKEDGGWGNGTNRNV